MNTRRAALLILMLTLLGLHTVYTRQEELDYSLRTGQLYAAADHLAEEKLELEVNLSTIRQPVSAARLASQYCPNLGPAHPELAAYQLAQDVPQMPVPSLRQRLAAAAARNPQPEIDPTQPSATPLEQARARQSFDSPDLSALPTTAASLTPNVPPIAETPSLPPEKPATPTGTASNPSAAVTGNPFIAGAAAAGSAAIAGVHLPASARQPGQAPAAAPGDTPRARVTEASAATAFRLLPAGAEPGAPVPTAVTHPALTPAVTLAPVPAAVPVSAPPASPSSAAPGDPASTPSPAAPPVDTDNPDADDAPQPVEWPEEPANDEPVFGWLQPAAVPASSHEVRHG